LQSRRIPGYGAGAIALLIAVYLLFNASFWYEVAGDGPASISISQESIPKTHNEFLINQFSAEYHTEREVASVSWLGNKREENYIVFGDYCQFWSILNSYGMISRKEIMDLVVINNTQMTFKNTYIYLSNENVKYGLIYGPSGGKFWPITRITARLNNTSIIYDNDGSRNYVVE
jgi:uncharacterized membrane protein